MKPRNNDNYEEPSKFNMAIATLMRINNLFYVATDAYLRGDWTSYYKVIQRLYIDTAFAMDEKQGKEIKKLFKEITPFYGDLIKSQGRKSKFTTVDKNNVAKLKQGLVDIDIQIKKILNDKGWLMPRMDDPRYSAYG